MIVNDIQHISLDSAQNIHTQANSAKNEQSPINEQGAQRCLAVVPVNAQTRQVDTSASLVVVRNVKKTYAHDRTVRTALDGVSLQVQRGEFVAITGPSGAGKSTLLHILGCLTRPSAGDYWLAGNMISLTATDELAMIRNQRIGFLFQEPALLTGVSALNNVALPLAYAGFAKAEQKRRAHTALQFMGLGARRLYTPDKLSTGQQQRVAIARALVNSPALLLADEPTGNLDARNGGEIIAILQALNQRGLTIVLATDNVELAMYAKRHVILQAGRIITDRAISRPRIAVEELVPLISERSTMTSTRIQEEKT